MSIWGPTECWHIFVNSGHDDQTLREVHDREPAPMFLEWALEKGIFDKDDQDRIIRGSNWGNRGFFVNQMASFKDLKSICLWLMISRAQARDQLMRFPDQSAPIRR